MLEDRAKRTMRLFFLVFYTALASYLAWNSVELLDRGVTPTRALGNVLLHVALWSMLVIAGWGWLNYMRGKSPRRALVVSTIIWTILCVPGLWAPLEGGMMLPSPGFIVTVSVVSVGCIGFLIWEHR